MLQEVIRSDIFHYLGWLSNWFYFTYQLLALKEAQCLCLCVWVCLWKWECVRVGAFNVSANVFCAWEASCFHTWVLANGLSGAFHRINENLLCRNPSSSSCFDEFINKRSEEWKRKVRHSINIPSISKTFQATSTQWLSILIILQISSSATFQVNHSL